MVSDGLQQEIEGIHLIAIKGILLKGGREDHPRTGRYHPGEVQPVQIRHLDIQEKHVHRRLAQRGERQYRIIEGSRQPQIRLTKSSSIFTAKGSSSTIMQVSVFISSLEVLFEQSNYFPEALDHIGNDRDKPDPAYASDSPARSPIRYGSRPVSDGRYSRR